jgi:hypothetical protein
MGEGLVADRVTAAVLDALPSAPVPADAMARLRKELLERLDGLGPPVRPSDEPPLVRVDRHRLAEVLACPASAGNPPFEWHALLAARRLGLAAISHMLHGRSAPLTAVTAAIETTVADGGSLGDWLGGLGPPERGTVTAATLSWTNRVWTTARWEQLGQAAVCRLSAGPIRVRLNATWGPTIVVGRPDATLWRRGESGLQQVLVLIGRPHPAAQRLDALAAALQRGRAPLRVASVDPASGCVDAADIDLALLSKAADDAVAAAEAVLAALGGAPRPAQPHAGCWLCWRGAACAEGAAWRTGQAARVGGLPISEFPGATDPPDG